MGYRNSKRSASQKLFQILKARTKDYDLTSRNATINYNESFHLVQLKYSNKSVVYPISQTIRDQLAVLDYNEGLRFALEL